MSTDDSEPNITLDFIRQEMRKLAGETIHIWCYGHDITLKDIEVRPDGTIQAFTLTKGRVYLNKRKYMDSGDHYGDLSNAIPRPHIPHEPKDRSPFIHTSATSESPLTKEQQEFKKFFTKS
jgi:hypothetical protein